jgi:cold shock protein
MERQRAVCVNWNRSFGWLKADDGGENLFCHNTELQMTGFRRLRPGQRVYFDRGQNERGLFAANVVLEADEITDGLPIVPAGTRENGKCVKWLCDSSLSPLARPVSRARPGR